MDQDLAIKLRGEITPLLGIVREPIEDPDADLASARVEYMHLVEKDVKAGFGRIKTFQTVFTVCGLGTAGVCYALSGDVFFPALIGGITLSMSYMASIKRDALLNGMRAQRRERIKFATLDELEDLIEQRNTALPLFTEEHGRERLVGHYSSELLNYYFAEKDFTRNPGKNPVPGVALATSIAGVLTGNPALIAGGVVVYMMAQTSSRSKAIQKAHSWTQKMLDDPEYFNARFLLNHMCRTPESFYNIYLVPYSKRTVAEAR